MPPTTLESSDHMFQHCSSMKHDFLMPNGIVLTLKPDPDISLADLKAHLWDLASAEPLYECLGPPNDYLFQGISSPKAEEEEFYDEQCKFAGLQLFLPFMRLEKVSDDAQIIEQKRNAMIAKISTISQAHLKAAEGGNPELAWARQCLLEMSEANMRRLEAGGPVSMAHYLTAASLQPKLNTALQRRLQRLPYLTISAVCVDCYSPPTQHLLKLNLPKSITVAAAIKEIIDEQRRLVQGDVSCHDVDPAPQYLLKVCCSQEYLFEQESALVHYAYVQECLQRDDIPRLTPVLLKDVLECLGLPVPEVVNCEGCTPAYPSPAVVSNAAPLPSVIDLYGVKEEDEDEGDEAMEASVDLWDLRDYFSLTVRAAQKLTTLTQNPSTEQLDTGLFFTGSSSFSDLTTDVTSSLGGSESSGSGGGGGASASTTPLSASSASSLDASSGSVVNYIVRVGLAHGGQLLAKYQNTRGAIIVMGGNSALQWNQSLNFRLIYSNLPLATRVCVVLLQVKRRPGRIMEFPVGWANMNLFDERGYLVTGRRSLPLWRSSFTSPETETTHQLNLAGTVAENPDPEFTLVLNFCHPSNQKARIRFPISRFITTVRGASPNTPTATIVPSLHSSDSDIRVIRDLIHRDPFYELSEQDKALLWRIRDSCCRRLYPAESLPWLVQAVAWERRELVEEFYRLLAVWPRPLPVETCLQLLGVAGLAGSAAAEGTFGEGGGGSYVMAGGRTTGVADPLVRDIAVQGLQARLSNADLADYLLQLVQVVRTEAFLVNPLTCFLLQRALDCPTLIGVRLCWHLRSQLDNPDARLRFGLILDALCRGFGPRLLLFVHEQVNALHRLTDLAISVKRIAEDEEQRARFKFELHRSEVRRDLEGILSPLRFSIKLGPVVEQQCTVKRSKKRPLWIVWANPDNLGFHHHKIHQLLFKHGDDLRQDMLTLQILKVMDHIWKDEGLNLDLTTYDCLATGDEMGLIEVVRNSQTIMSIQGQRVRSAMQIDSSQLHKWFLQKKAPPLGSEEAYESAIRRFTNSCAGYCVATFVLGIRDRHNDNIMVDDSGRLFHIDFGHILNNKKKKFGITRERVPFVLTSDFACVIARGEEKPYRSKGFMDFTRLCEDAYRILRRHSNLLLTLLAMMVPSGLPELTCASDLEYVRKTLAVELRDEEEALNYFNAKFNEAYNGAWTTKIDWFAHWVRR
ncbi:phosphatidylinositol 45 bisphosphate 3 kinase [Echinococcus multilocularis]|uniref:Phosphatidylinositol 45 bisphosphate 3 kinase n=1 Tax=Echinococcus multilocularis TaxID=6211 RepID=A0A068Y496_ECHMU|nr:phosphatidylinositol 45 bisphosphate 3 kinase [Echinococcus multilocularis]